MSTERSPISTHILDTTLGKPASNVKVQIYFLQDSHWVLMSEGFTNDNGRHVSDIKRADFASGTYKLKFQVDDYYKRNNQTSIYPFVEVSVNLSRDEEYYHIPLLLNPYGYSTYRGS